ncbi:MAG: membrane integrity-associated transporter subunit PqiC, partial [Lentisphaeria bacterium]|nr:membrane integrity-associated transporter subunit PqiC [Lentisphaeria bacterium]
MQPFLARATSLLPRAGGLLLLIWVCSGCRLGGTYRPIAHYGLDCPAGVAETAAAIEGTLQIGRFGSKVPAGTRMLERGAGQRLFIDEYNRWADDPERLVEREFLRCLAERRVFANVVDSDADTADLTLGGTLLALERTEDGQALVSVLVRFENPETGEISASRVFSNSRKLTGATSAAFAEACAGALDTIVTDVAEAL